MESIFPPELRTIVYHQNKIGSEFGHGWKLNLNQRIINPTDDRIMLENEDGSVSSYILQTTVENVLSDQNGIESISYNNDKLIYADTKGNIYSKANTRTNKSLVSQTQNYVGSLGVNSVKILSQGTYCCKSGISGCTKRCPKYYNLCEKSTYAFNLSKKIHNIIELENEGLLFLDQYGAIWQNHQSESVTAGLVANIGRVESSNGEINSGCQNIIQNNCEIANRTSYQSINFATEKNPPTLGQCGTMIGSSGYFPVMGYSASGLTSSKFNKPLTMIQSGNSNTLIVADTGNNVVRKVFLGSNSTAVIAGNQQTYDNGDGGPATSASLYHPRGLALDSLGNLYISTERGYIRKVEPNGNISTIAGKPLNQGGQLVQSGPMDKFYLNSPSALVIDEENGFLYVADTGNHRIVQLDLIDGLARVIAGKGSCVTNEPIKEGLPALEMNICSPVEFVLDSDKNLLFADKNTNEIKKILLNKGANGIQRYASSVRDNSVLIRKADGSFERRLRDGTTYFYNAQGLHLSTRDSVNRLTSFQYDQENRLVSFTDPTGSQTTLSYSGERLTQITDPANRVTNFNYNGDGNLVEVQFPDGSSKEFSYDADNLMIQEVNQRGYATSYNFNDLKKLVSVTTPDNATIELQDSTSKTHYNSLDGSSRKLVNYNEASSDGIADTIKNPKGAETAFVKEVNGYVSKIIDAEDRATLIERDSEGRPTKITRPDNTFSQFTYNQITGDLVARYESSTNSTESFTYNERGQLTLHTSPSGRTVERQYDLNTGLLLKEIDHRGVFILRTYGYLGLISSITNNLGQISSYLYDNHGNLTNSILPMNEEVIYTRDLAGNIITKKSPKNEVTGFNYDSFNRLTSVITPSSQTTTYSYLPTGELTQIISPNNNITTYDYNVMGRLVKKTSPKGQLHQLSYDQNGNVIQEIDPKGQIKTYEYNLLDQLVRKILPDNEYTYSYTDSGKPYIVTSMNSSFELSYTQIHGEEYLTGVSQNVEDIPTNTMTYSYSPDGQVTSMSSDFINMSYSYDGSGNLKQVQNSLGQSFGFGYDNSNRLTSVNSAGVIFTQNVFDANSFLTEIVHRKSNIVVSSFNYTRDANNYRQTMTTLHGTHSYQYDNEGQLISASHPEADAIHSLESFSYDSLGNRMAENQGNYVYDDKTFQLVEDWKFIYAYDLNGNLVTKQEKGLSGNVQNFTYSSENQLIQIDFIEGGNLTKQAIYSYDALGRRVKKRVLENNQETIRKYVYNSNEIIAELDEENEILVRYTHSGLRTDDVLAMNVTSNGVSTGFAPSTGNYYFLKDGLGSVTDITDSTGHVVQHFVYSSFGKILKIQNGGLDKTTSPDIKSSFTYTNREYDFESGLYHYRARYYDPSPGRFLQEDPYPGIALLPISFTTAYTYAVNNPIMNTDPNGKIAPLVIIGIAALMGGLTNAYLNKNEGTFIENFFYGAIIGTISSGVGIGIGAAVSAVFGAGLTGSILAGVAGGAASSIVSQLLATGSVSWGLVLMGGELGGIGGAVGYGLSSAEKATQTAVQKGTEIINQSNYNFFNGLMETINVPELP